MQKEKLLSYSINNFFVKEDNFIDEYHKLSHNVLAADRFCYANRYSSYYMDTILKEIPSFNKCFSFNDCMMKRAEEIYLLAKKENKKIVLSYSGGVDSSSILTAFLLLGIEKEILIILYSKSAIEEYPWMFDFLLKEKYKMIKITSENMLFVFSYFLERHLVIFGNCGDMIFFSRDEFSNREDYRNYFKKNNFSKKSIEQAEDILQYYNINSKETCTVIWWLDYCIKYTHVLYLELYYMHLHYYPIIFFNSALFDDYACCNMDKKYFISLEGKKYRTEQKQFIKLFTKNSLYDEKEKVCSWMQFRNIRNNNKIGNYFTYWTTSGFYTIKKVDAEKVLKYFET